jgi:hypothetical protein
MPNIHRMALQDPEFNYVRPKISSKCTDVSLSTTTATNDGTRKV